jgi:hypothetical protein
MERFEAHSDPKKVVCRKAPISQQDIASFVSYSAAHMIPDSGEGFALVLKYIASGAGTANHVPCADVGGYWTNAHLLALCTHDNSGGSPCKFYEDSLMQTVHLEEAVGKQRYFCPDGSPIRSDDEALQHYKDWLATHKEMSEAPAALGLIDALSAAYPCQKS